MRRFLLPLTAAALLVTAVPAAAEHEGEPHPVYVECDAPAAGVTVVKPADFAGTVEAPLLKGDTTSQTFQLDLSPNATALNKASVSADIDWTLAANDWDLFVYDAGGGELGASEGLQPLDAPAESAPAGKLLHCSEFSVEVLNFQAVGVPEAVDTINLRVTVGTKS